MPALPPPAEFPFIPNARPHSIDDRQLDKLALIAEDARMGNATEAEADWVLSAPSSANSSAAARRWRWRGSRTKGQTSSSSGRCGDAGPSAAAV